MFEKMQKLEVSQEELAIIEDALHTQSQILNVEVGAGGATARARLNGVKRLLSMLDQHKTTQDVTKKQPCSTGWLGMARLLG